ncbi:MAG: hypothetical protein ACRDCE_05635 [Cetobacterium sp.]|uniref:hypothetical protein n=1 Tax=Cetobacterium sp. TaxID=2071632 RepID=UPI003EE586D0
MSSSTLSQLRWRYLDQMLSVNYFKYSAYYDTMKGITPRGKAYRKILKIERVASLKRLEGKWEGSIARLS